MITKHFFKILFLFVCMIILGLLGILVVSYMDRPDTDTTASAKTGFAK
jgi:hypothetical protein